MDLLKKQLDRIQQQITGLSISQKMLTASLVAIMVMTFVWWGRYAGTSEMEPVVNQSLTPDDMQNVRRVLRAENINFDAQGDKILVPTEKKEEAIAALALQQALPRDSAGSYEEIFNNLSPFTSPQMTDKISNKAMEQNMARVMAKMPGVAEAYVTIDPTSGDRIGGNIEPSASVVIITRGTADKKMIADGVAEMLSGVNANLRRSRVRIVIDGKPFPMRDRDPNTPDGEIDAQQAAAESRNQDKIKAALRGYGDVIAVVTAHVDAIATNIDETTHPKVVTKDTRSQSESTKTSTPQPPSAEPGAAANTGGTLSTNQGAASGASTSETEKDTTESTVIPDEKVEHSIKPPGTITVTSASVSVPRSYFVNMLKSNSASDKEPGPTEVKKLFEEQRATILGTIVNSVDIPDSNKVTLDMYFDAPLMMAAGSSSAGGGESSSPIVTSLGGHVKEIAVGMLALLSLFMVSMMVKKSAPAPVVAAAVEMPGPVTLGGNLDIAGEVHEGGQMLDGMELDEDAVKAQQMVEQVSTMVKENPDAAATMVKRWLNRS
jgi:flagellar biosynthesis/type III secretory pathway M-ring protein FliF/YscJ